MAWSQRYGNETIDALNKGCLGRYEPVACSRVGILVLVCGATLLLVVSRIVKYHSYRHSRIHHYLIFYIAAVQCILCVFGSVFGTRHAQLDFASYYVKLLHFVLVCHVYWSTAAENLRRDDVIQHAVNPVLGLYTLYLTAVVLMGMVDIGTTWNQCLRPYWLMLSGADFAVVQLFALVALYLTYDGKRTAMSALVLPAIRINTRDIWLIVLAYETSASVSVLYDAFVMLVGNEETGCSGIYNHVQVYYSLLIGVVTILKYLLPTWTLLWVLQPVRVKSRPSEVGLTFRYNMERNCDNQYRRILFSPNVGLSTSLSHHNHHSTIPYPCESPLYGSFGDFSYADSLSDVSPTLANRWSISVNANGDEDDVEENGAEDADARNVAEKRDDREDSKDVNRDSCATRVAGSNDEKFTVTSCDLATINEESGNVAESPHR